MCIILPHRLQCNVFSRIREKLKHSANTLELSMQLCLFFTALQPNWAIPENSGPSPIEDIGIPDFFSQIPSWNFRHFCLQKPIEDTGIPDTFHFLLIFFWNFRHFCLQKPIEDTGIPYLFCECWPGIPDS